MSLISMNFNEPCINHVPTVFESFKAMTPLGFSFLSIATLLSILTFLIFVDELYYIYVKVPYKSHKERLYWVIGIFPVFSMTSLLGIYVPRSGVLVDFVASVYLSIALFQFFQLIVEYFGGKSNMLEILSDSTLQLSSPPLACCCPCLPRVPFVKKNFYRLKAAVFQTALVRPVLIFISAVLWTDGSYYTPGQISQADAYPYLSFMTTISTLTGMYGLVMVYRVSKQHLKHDHIGAKFISIQLVLIFSNIQGSLLDLLATKNVIKCVAPFNSRSRGSELNHLLLVMECFILGVLLHHYYRREALHNHPQVKHIAIAPSKYSQAHSYSKDVNAALSKKADIFPEKIANGNNNNAPSTKDKDYFNKEEELDSEAKIISGPEYDDSLGRASENVPAKTQKNEINKNRKGFKEFLKPARKLTLVSVLRSQQQNEQLIQTPRRRITVPSQQGGRMIGLERVEPSVNVLEPQQNDPIVKEGNYYAQNLNNNNNHLVYYNQDMGKEFYDLADNYKFQDKKYGNFNKNIANILIPEDTSVPSFSPSFSNIDHEGYINTSPSTSSFEHSKSISIDSLFSPISARSNETPKFDTNNIAKISHNYQIIPNNNDLSGFLIFSDVIESREGNFDNLVLTNPSCSSSYTEDDTLPYKVYHNCNNENDVDMTGRNTYHLLKGFQRFRPFDWRDNKFSFKNPLFQEYRRIENRVGSLKSFKSLTRLEYLACLNPHGTHDDYNQTKLIDNCTKCNTIDLAESEIHKSL